MKEIKIGGNLINLLKVFEHEGYWVELRLSGSDKLLSGYIDFIGTDFIALRYTEEEDKPYYRFVSTEFIVEVSPVLSEPVRFLGAKPDFGSGKLENLGKF